MLNINANPQGVLQNTRNTCIWIPLPSIRKSNYYDDNIPLETESLRFYARGLVSTTSLLIMLGHSCQGLDMLTLSRCHFYFDYNSKFSPLIILIRNIALSFRDTNMHFLPPTHHQKQCTEKQMCFVILGILKSQEVSCRENPNRWEKESHQFAHWVGNVWFKCMGLNCQKHRPSSP